MNPYSASFVKKILKDYKIFPSKKLGQNFLVCEKIARKVIDEADLKKEDLVLEVGPGLGALTQILKEKKARVLAVEKDKRLFSFLKENYGEEKRIQVLNTDILDFLDHFAEKNYKIVASLPYPITSYFLRKVFSKKNKPSSMVLIVQKEVGEKICAQPPFMNVLSVVAQFYSHPTLRGKVPKNCFFPQPAVDSVIVKFEKIHSPLSEKEEEIFLKILKAGFSSKRKFLKNNLSEKLKIPDFEIEKIFQKIGFSSKIRAENLSKENWLVLTKELQFFLKD